MLEVPRELQADYYCREVKGRQCRHIDKSDIPALPDLVAKMRRYCVENNGVALSAPQVGLYVRLVVMVYPVYMVLVNPELINLAGRDLLEHEGCLSLPPNHKATAKVLRSEFVEVRTGNMENPDAGERLRFRDYAARVVQHELDHLHGVFFIERCGAVGRQLVLRQYSREMRRRIAANAS